MPAVVTAPTGAAGRGWLFGDLTDRRYRVVRRGLAVLIGLRLGLQNIVPLGDQPDDLFRPPALLSPLAGVPPAGVLVAVQVVGVVAAVLAAGVRRPGTPRSGTGGMAPGGPGAPGGPTDRRSGRVGALLGAWSFAVAWGCLLLLAAAKTSGGKILHNDVLLLLAAFAFALVPENVPGAPRRNVGWPVRLGVVVISASYAFAGLAKMKHSGWDWVFSDNMRYVMYWAAQTGRPGWPGLTEAIGDSWLLSRLVAASILGVELAFPLAVAFRRVRPAFALAAVGLHLGTWLTLGLDYWGWAVTVVLVLVDWDRVRWPRRTDRPPGRGAAVAAR